MKNLLYPDEQFQIRPSDISLEDHFWDTFDNSETEVSARWIVRLSQQRGSWAPFTYDEIEALIQSRGFKYYSFNHLLSGKWIVKLGMLYYITVDFVNRIYTKQQEQ